MCEERLKEPGLLSLEKQMLRRSCLLGGYGGGGHRLCTGGHYERMRSNECKLLQRHFLIGYEVLFHLEES